MKKCCNPFVYVGHCGETHLQSPPHREPPPKYSRRITAKPLATATPDIIFEPSQWRQLLDEVIVPLDDELR